MTPTPQRGCIHCGSLFDVREGLLYCAACRQVETARESQRVAVQNHRAALVGCPADLILGQWLQTLADFNGLCAYCQQRPFEHLEHFIPIDAGGGTTLGNCVPACGRCNYSKGTYDPDLPQGELFVNDPRERVRAYLASRAAAEEEADWWE